MEALNLEAGSFVDLGSTSSLGLSNESFTIEVWVRLFRLTDELSTATKHRDQTILGVDKPRKREGVNLLIRNGRPFFEFSDAGYVMGNKIEAERWYHIAVTCKLHDGGYAADRKLYVDGFLHGYIMHAPSCIGDAPVKLGRSEKGNPLLGQITGLSIWNHPRTEEQIREDLFTTSRAALPANVPGMTMDWNSVNDELKSKNVSWEATQIDLDEAGAEIKQLENLSLGKKGDQVRSSGDRVASNPLEQQRTDKGNACDGRWATRWSSDVHFHAERQGYCWLQVDLGSRQNVRKVAIRFESQHPLYYEVFVADNENQLKDLNEHNNWRESAHMNRAVLCNKDTSEKVVDVHEMERLGRFVRVVCRQGAQAGRGMSICSLDVWGPRDRCAECIATCVLS